MADSNYQDDFTRIDGIKAHHQQILQEHANLATFQDLANATIDEIRQAFKLAGKRSPTKNQIEKWILGAKAFLGAEIDAGPSKIWLKGFAVEFSLHVSEDEETQREVNVCDLNITSEGDWQVNGKEPLLTFLDSDEIDLYAWMLAQPGLEGWGQPIDETQSSIATDKNAQIVQIGEPNVTVGPTREMTAEEYEAWVDDGPEFSLHVDQIEISQRTSHISWHRISQRFDSLPLIESQYPVDLVATVQIPELNKLDKASSYGGQFFVKDENGTSHIGSYVRHPLLPGQTSYTLRLTDIYLNRGINSIGVIIHAIGRSALAAYLQTEAIQVL